MRPRLCLACGPGAMFAGVGVKPEPATGGEQFITETMEFVRNIPVSGGRAGGR